MSKAQPKYWSLKTIKRNIAKAYHDNNSVLDECALINIKRIYYLTIIAIPIRILDIFLFTTTVSNNTSHLKTWSNGIITSHFILLFLMIIFFLMSHRLKKRTQPNTTMFLLQYIVVITIMTSGVVIVSIDQLVTTSITPFILVCVVVGSVFLIRPLISAIIYLTSYLVYYNLIALTITNQQVLLSNRVNGITAIGIGFLISIVIWRYNYITITQKRRIEMKQKQLEQMAYYDSLTGLPNRRFLEKVIKKELPSMQRHNHESVIIIMDIDNFKNINDTYGHLVGDNILKQMAGLLENNIRETDTLSRFGGEEFIILMPQTSLEEGFALAERLKKIIMENKFTVGSIVLQITASFGVSLLHDVNGQGLEEYFSPADKALYLAKRSGKNKVEIAESL